MMSGCRGESPVAREQRRVERFREGDVDGVVGSEIVPQIPDTRQKEIVRIPAQRKVGQVGESRATTLAIDLASRRIPADDLRYFNIEQMGRMQRLSRIEQPPFHSYRCRRAEECLEQSRSVDHDHCRSRSARTA